MANKPSAEASNDPAWYCTHEYASDDDEISRQVAALSEEALEAYLGRRFEQAAALYGRVAALRPKDRAAIVMIERSAHYLASPPPDNWTGVHVATEK